MMPPPPPSFTATTTTTPTTSTTAEEPIDSSSSEALEEIIKHYDMLDRQSSKSDSKIFHMRNFNNWVKTCLINEAIGNANDDGLPTSFGKKNKKNNKKSGGNGNRRKRNKSDTLKVFDFACGKVSVRTSGRANERSGGTKGTKGAE